MILFQRNSESIAVFSADQLQKRIAMTATEIRKRKGLTQNDMAKKFSMSPTAYAKIEKGQTKIDFEKSFIFCEALDITMMDLLGLEDVANSKVLERLSEKDNEIMQLKNTIADKELVNKLLHEKLTANGIKI